MLRKRLQLICLLFLAPILATAGEIQPRLQGTLRLSALANAIAAQNNVAYIASSDGLTVIDISNPSNLRATAHVATPGAAIALAISGNLAFVATPTGLQIIDIADPASPRIIGAHNSPNCASLAISGPAVYIASGSSIAIIDATDPANPVRRGAIAYTTAKIAANDRVLCAIQPGPSALTVEIFDLTDPFNPWPASRIQRSPGGGGMNSFMDVALSGDTLLTRFDFWEFCCEFIPAYYVSTTASAYDLSDPQNPVPRSHVSGARVPFSSMPGFFLHNSRLFETSETSHLIQRAIIPNANLAALSNDLLITANGAELSAYRLDPANPRSTSTTLLGQNVNAVATRENLAYIATSSALKILDIGDPAVPRPIYEVALQGANNLVRVENYLYVSSSAGLITFDLANPISPRQTTRYPLGLSNVKHGNGHLYAVSLETATAGVYGFDISDPAFPALRWPRFVNTYQTLLAASDRHVFLGSGYLSSGAVNVHDTTTHAVAGSWSRPGFVQALHLEGDKGYCLWGARFEILDLTNPTAPVVLGFANLPEAAYTLAILGRHAYVRGADSLLVVDLRDESNPRLVARTQSLIPAHLHSDGRRLHLASGNAGYSILEPHPQIWLHATPSGLRLDAPPWTAGQLQSSPDLQDWQDTQLISFGEEPFHIPLNGLPANRFFRFRSSPE